MITVGDLAKLIGGTVIGDDSAPVSGVSSVDDAEPGTVVVAEDSRYLALALQSQATAIVTALAPRETPKAAIRVTDTRRALSALLDYFSRKDRPSAGIDRHAHVGSNFRSGANLSVGCGAYVGDGVVVGDNVVIYPHAYVGDDVHLGSDVVIHPNVTIYPGSEIGNRVMIHAGSVIGSDGFGYLWLDGEHRKIPHTGKVVIEDDVEIGACSTIDRAKMGVTRIGRGTKIDNLVHVAHNCKIGEKSLLVAQVGVAGSVVIGDGVVLAGQAGVKDHVTVGDAAVVAARSGVIGNVAPGARVSGFPAREHQENMRAQAVFTRLPDVLKCVRDLEAKVAALEAQLSRNGDDVGTSD